jgi:hypothetical protein
MLTAVFAKSLKAAPGLGCRRLKIREKRGIGYELRGIGYELEFKNGEWDTNCGGVFAKPVFFLSLLRIRKTGNWIRTAGGIC